MAIPNPLTCQELVELVTEYLEGKLPAAKRAQFDEHLAVCPGCRIFVEQMRQTIRAVGKLTQESIRPEIRQELVQIFQDWKKG